MNDLSPQQYAIIERGGPIECWEAQKYDLPMSRSEVRLEAICHGRTYRLVHKTKGCRLAGACLLWAETETYVAQTISHDGTPGGRSFHTHEEALAQLETWIERREAEYQEVKA